MKTEERKAADGLRLHERQSPMLVVLVLTIGLILSGCATWQQPKTFDVSVLRARAEMETMGGVRLSAAVLSSAESQQMFGADVNQSGVQPVWIELENNTDQALWLMRAGTDPDLFSPLEVAWTFHKAFAADTNASIDEHFDALSFQNPILPGETKSGILYTNPHRKTRLLVIDILGKGQLFPFTLFPRVPDDVTDETARIDKARRLIEAATVDYQHADEFRAALEQLPCCASNADASQAGDPVNVVLVGTIEDIATAVIRRGFRTDKQAFDDEQHLFDRKPDFVVRKVGQDAAPANWLRIWVAPLRYQGKPVFLVQAGRPLGWRFANLEERDEFEEQHEHELAPTLNPEIDEVRDLLIEDLLYSGGLEKLAFVAGVGATEPEEYRSSLGDNRYHTDGLRAVMFLVTRPLSLSDLELLDWHPLLKLREIEALENNENKQR
jgi:hypothetical protein